MAYIKKLKDINDNTVYPQTHTNAVYNAKGEQLQSWMDKYLTTEEIVNIDNIDFDFELKSNKVNSINANSTDAEYPSAKATYDLIAEKLAALNVGLKIEVVEILPLLGDADSQTIYFIQSEEPEEQNTYDEYLLVNGAWEHLGTTKIDLSGYYTKEESNSNFASKEKYADDSINLGRREDTGSIGTNSVAVGDRVQANHNYSIAMGSLAQANAMAAIALGREARANGLYSIALGEGAIAKNQGSVAMGKWNVEDTTGTILHTVGNGTSSSARSNAHTIDNNGSAWFQGEVYVGSSTGVNKDSGSVKLAKINELPTKTSQLTNDSGFINSASNSPTKIKYTWSGTEAQYAALGTKNPDTLYITTD